MQKRNEGTAERNGYKTRNEVAKQNGNKTENEDKISIGNYKVREVVMKNHTCVWRNVYNTASAKHERHYKYVAKHKCNFSLILRGQV